MLSQTYRIALNRIALIEKPDKSFPWNDYMARFVIEDISPDELLLRIGRGFGFAPIFGNDGYPRLENFRETSFLVVDMDTEDNRSSLATLSQHPLVAYHGAIIYPTHSYTPERPRHRVVFLLNEPLKRPESVVAMQKFLAGAFGSNDYSLNANKTWQANGKIDADNLWDICYLPDHFYFSPEQVVNYLNQYQAAERRKLERQTKQQHRQTGAEQGENYMPLRELSQRLGRIDPYSMGYDEWVKLGAAIAHSYGQDAFWVFKDWSDTPGKTPMTMAVYKAMMRDHPNAAGYGTIIKLLKEHNA